jgi:hypothetical protein
MMMNAGYGLEVRLMEDMEDIQLVKNHSQHIGLVMCCQMVR